MSQEQRSLLGGDDRALVSYDGATEASDAAEYDDSGGAHSGGVRSGDGPRTLRSAVSKVDPSPARPGLPSPADPAVADLFDRTSLQAFFNITKGFAGAASFELPWAVGQAGLTAGLLGFVVLGLLSQYSLLMLPKCALLAQEQRGYALARRSRRRRRQLQSGGNLQQEEQEEEEEEAFSECDSIAGHHDDVRPAVGDEDDDDEDAATIAADEALIGASSEAGGSRVLTLVGIGATALGPRGGMLVWGGTLLITLGACGSYFVFIGKALSILLVDSYPWLTPTVGTLVAVPVVVRLAWVRDYALLAPTSVVGLLALLFAVGFTMYDAAQVRVTTQRVVAAGAAARRESTATHASR